MTTAYQEFSPCGETIVLCQWQSTLGKVLFSLNPYSNNRYTGTLPLCHIFPLSEMTCERLLLCHSLIVGWRALSRMRRARESLRPPRPSNTQGVPPNPT